MATKYFGMRSADLVADGSAGAVAELARRGRGPDGRKGGEMRKPVAKPEAKPVRVTPATTTPILAYATDQGGRSYQEDSVFAGSFGKYHLLCVADGMGGHKGGKEASQAVLVKFLEVLPDYLTMPRVSVRAAMQQAFQDAHKESAEVAPSGGTTLSVLMFTDAGKCFIAWAGDSPIVVLRSMHPIFRARAHGSENSLYNGLGGVFYRREPRVQLDIEEIDLVAGDLCIVASDGLDEVLKKEDASAPDDLLLAGIPWLKQQNMRDQGQLTVVCVGLIALTIQQGSTDNCSVAMAVVR